MPLYQNNTIRLVESCTVSLVLLLYSTEQYYKKCEILISHRPLAMKQLHLLASHFFTPVFEQKIDQTRLTRHEKVKTQTHSPTQPIGWPNRRPSLARPMRAKSELFCTCRTCGVLLEYQNVVTLRWPFLDFTGRLERLSFIWFLDKLWQNSWSDPFYVSKLKCRLSYRCLWLCLH